MEKVKKVKVDFKSNMETERDSALWVWFVFLML